MKTGRPKVHGHCPRSGPSEVYVSWSRMIDRCLNPRHVQYHNYGGRGIQVCEDWLKFENFLKDMGEPPEGFTLDRIDTDGHYCPGNCRWVSRQDQAKNKRDTRRLVLNGVEYATLEEIAAAVGISVNTLFYRLYRKKMTLEESVSIPVGQIERVPRFNPNSIKAYARKHGIKYSTLHNRVKNLGWSLNKAVKKGIKEKQEDTQ